MAHAWVAGWVPNKEHMRGSQHILMFLPLLKHSFFLSGPIFIIYRLKYRNSRKNYLNSSFQLCFLQLKTEMFVMEFFSVIPLFSTLIWCFILRRDSTCLREDVNQYFFFTPSNLCTLANTHRLMYTHT